MQNSNNKSNEVIVSAIKRGNKNLLEDLIGKNYGLIFWSAKKFSDQGELDDLIQEGIIGLHMAVNMFDESKGVLFSTYAAIWIKQTMRRFIENNKAIHIPSYRMNQIKKYNHLKSDYIRDIGREPEDRELALLLDVSPEDIEDIKAAASVQTLSLNAPITGTDIELGESIPCKTDMIEQAENAVYLSQLKSAVSQAVDELPQEQAEVLRSRYQGGKTFKEISEDLGKNAYHIHEKAIRTLRQPRHRKNLSPFTDLYSKAIRRSGTRAFNETWTSSTEREALKL